VQLAPGLIHLDLPGGEPFLSGIDEQKKLLQHYIDIGRSSQITLHYTTNSTIFPDDSWWQLWNSFKEIDIQLSIDAVGDRYEYIRYPANWSQVVLNVDQYIAKSQHMTNLKLSVSHTVSAYNVYYLDEFFSWCYNIGLPRPWLGRVHNPKHMRPTVWPAEVRDIIAQHLRQSNYPDVYAWATMLENEDDSVFFQMFLQRRQQHDQYRGLDFNITFSELAKHT
jgi:hypothetical protein